MSSSSSKRKRGDGGDADDVTSRKLVSKPCDGTIEEGKVVARFGMRGIGMSRASFTVFCGYHPETVEKVNDFGIKGFDSSGLDSFYTSKCSSLFEESYKEVLKKLKNSGTGEAVKETDLTNELATELVKKELEFSVKVEGKVKETDLTRKLAIELEKKELEFPVKVDAPVADGEGKVDLLFYKKKSTAQSDSSQQSAAPRNDVPFGLVEVGLLSQTVSLKQDDIDLEGIFWKKFKQGTKYLDLLQEDSEKRWRWEGPLLLCVLVANRDCSKSRIAIFICEPQEDGKRWRMALMWRDQCENLVDLSKAFGYYINGLNYLFENSDSLAPRSSEIVWEYLGPSCTRIKRPADKVQAENDPLGEECVIRVFDNSFRHSYRSPFVYKNEAILKDRIKEIFCIPETGTETCSILDFAADLQEGKGHDRSMLFRKWNSEKREEGKVEVIAVPFFEGDHVCKSAKQALALVRELQAIHKQGLAHADIRSFNISFSKDRVTAHFIDWDFGGPVYDTETNKRVRYPPGYQGELKDGQRVGIERQVVELEHDVQALAYVLGYLHEPVKSRWFLLNVWQSYLQTELQKATTLEDMITTLERMGNVSFIPTKKYQNYLNGRETKNITAKLGHKISPERKQQSIDQVVQPHSPPASAAVVG